MSLKTNYKDDVLSSSNPKRKYNKIDNADGTISLTDASSYDVVGDTFGAQDINATNEAINNLSESVDFIKVVDTLPSDASSHPRTLYLSKS